MYKYEVKLIQGQETVNWAYGSKSKVLEDIGNLLSEMPVDEEVDIRFIKRYADSFAGDGIMLSHPEGISEHRPRPGKDRY